MKYGELITFYKGTHRFIATYTGHCDKCNCMCYSNPFPQPNNGLGYDEVAIPPQYTLAELATTQGLLANGICKNCFQKTR